MRRGRTLFLLGASIGALALLAAACTGDAGSQGSQGPAGAAGTTGSAGAEGPQGPSGAAGATGTQGEQGAQGIQGAAGSAGASGATALAEVDPVATVHLLELGGSGQFGVATLTPQGAQTEVVISLAPGEVGISQPIHIHEGACDSLGGVKYPLSSVVSGRSVTLVDATLASIQNGNMAINLHKSVAEIGTYTACGNIPLSEQIAVGLGELNDSGQTGVAVLTAMGTQTQVTISASALPDSQPVHIHNGSCDNLGGVAYALTNVVDGASTTVVDVSLAELRASLFAINAHQSVAEIGTYTACGNVAAGSSVTIALGQLSDSGQTGSATLTQVGSKTQVTINAGALPDSQPVHIHNGTCDTLGGVAYALTNVEDGMSTTLVDVSLAELRAAPFAVNLHKSSDEIATYTACGNLMAGAPPAPAPTGSDSGTTTPEPTTAPEVSSNIQSFQLEDLTITVGTTVTWTNLDSAPHTSSSGTSPSKSGIWDTGTLSTGNSGSITFNEAGTFAYFCTIHPSMTATVTVTES